MFGRRTPKTPTHPTAPRPGVGTNCCVRTVPGQQLPQRPQRPMPRPNPFVKR